MTEKCNKWKNEERLRIHTKREERVRGKREKEGVKSSRKRESSRERE
jgi:hypothetical protein